MATGFLISSYQSTNKDHSFIAIELPVKAKVQTVDQLCPKECLKFKLCCKLFVYHWMPQFIDELNFKDVCVKFSRLFLASTI